MRLIGDVQRSKGLVSKTPLWQWHFFTARHNVICDAAIRFRLKTHTTFLSRKNICSMVTQEQVDQFAVVPLPYACMWFYTNVTSCNNVLHIRHILSIVSYFFTFFCTSNIPRNSEPTKSMDKLPCQRRCEAGILA